MVESAGNEEFAYRKITSLLGIDEVTCRNRYESISQYRLEILDREIASRALAEQDIAPH
jgi:hypothetical protein